MSEASRQFEDRVVNCLLREGNAVIRQNSPSRGQIGFVGLRKPDLLSINPELQITVWELKSPAECTGIDHRNRSHMWFRHPTPTRDYISELRQSYRQNESIPAQVAGWCIVLKGELAYWCRNSGTAWRHPIIVPPGRSILAGVAAPFDQQDNIKKALRHLGWMRWQNSDYSGITFLKGCITEEQIGENE